jgi:thiol-disulfide isomerase/thioredoxin
MDFHHPASKILPWCRRISLCGSFAACLTAWPLIVAAAPPAPAPPAKSGPNPPASTAPTSAPHSSAKRLEVAPADLKWLDRLPKEDRAALEELLGWAPPPFATHLQWVGSASAPTWADLRGKVVVVQSFTTSTAAGRGWPQRVATNLKDIAAKDLRIIALHTPDDAADATEFLSRKPAPEGVVVGIDSSGAYCDELAIYKQPVNIVVDRNGAVRYAGLNNTGLELAVKALVAEPFNQNSIVPQRGEGDGEDANAAATPVSGEFPPITGKIDSALDIRGKSAPEFFVSQWITQPPNAEGKVVVLDFWATWCGPCVASIPHMNDLATRFRDSVVCVGISSEKPADFEKGMARLQQQKKITLNTFQYALALDPSSKMAGAMKITGIPHCIVTSRDRIVRWQGHPASLDAATLEKIVKADAAQSGAGGKSAPPGSTRRKRWVND